MGPPPQASASGRFAPPQPNEQIGPYRIERELARGGMGVVYIARHIRLERRVALKVQLDLGAGGEEAERFQIEAQAAARLNHPHIVAIHEVGDDGGRPYLAMDLVEGRSLKDQIDAEGPLDQVEAARICGEMADALYYAHSRAILHRDIKPHNILIDGAGRALLTDFGLAKQIDREEQGLTQTGQIMGTPAYMPPEQADGDLERVDRRADIYALGATLYQALTGAPPFAGQTAMQVVYKVLHEEAPSPRKLRADLDPDLETICLKCLQKEPEDRYGTAKDLAEDLARFRRGEPIAARPVGLIGRLARRARRNRGATRALLGVALLVFAAVSVAAVLADVQRRRALAAGVEEGKARREADEARAKAVAEKHLAQAQSKVFLGLNQLALTRPLPALETFREAVDALEEAPSTLRRSAAFGARSAAKAGCFAGLVAVGRGDRSFCDTWLGPGAGALAYLEPDGLRVFAEPKLQEVLFEQPAPASQPCFVRFLPTQGLLLVGATGPEEGRAVVRAYEWPGGGLRWELSEPGFVVASSLVVPTSRGVAIALQAAGSGAAQTCQVWLLDWSSGQRVGVLDSGARPNSLPAVAGSGGVQPGQDAALLLGYDDGTVHVWDLTKLAPANALHLHTDEVRGSVTALSFLPPGRFGAGSEGVTILTGTGGGTSKRTTFPGGRSEVLARYPKGAVQTLAWVLEPEPRLALSYEDGRVRVYDGALEEIASFGAGRGPARSLAFAQEGRRLYVTHRGSLARWSVPSRRSVSVAQVRNLVTRTEPPVLALSPGGRVAFVAAEAIEVRDLNRTGSAPIRIPIGEASDLTPDPGHPGGDANLRPAVRALALSEEGGLAAAIRPWRSMFNGNPTPGRVEVWSLSGPTRVARFPLSHEIPDDRLGRPLETVGSLDFSPEGQALFQGFELRDGAREGRALVRDLREASREGPGDRLVWHLNTTSAAARGAAGWVSASLDGTLAWWPEAGAARAPRRVFDLSPRTPAPGAAHVPSLGDPPRSTTEAFRSLLGRAVPAPGERSAEGVWSLALGRWRWGSERLDLALAGTGQGELALVALESGQILSRWEAHGEGGVFACGLIEEGLILSVGQEAKLWVEIQGRFYPLEQHALAPPGGRVLAARVAGTRVAALVERLERLERIEEGEARALVTLDLALPELPGFERDPQAALKAYRERSAR